MREALACGHARLVWELSPAIIVAATTKGIHYTTSKQQELRHCRSSCCLIVDVRTGIILAPARGPVSSLFHRRATTTIDDDVVVVLEAPNDDWPVGELLVPVANAHLLQRSLRVFKVLSRVAQLLDAWRDPACILRPRQNRTSAGVSFRFRTNRMDAHPVLCGPLAAVSRGNAWDSPE